MNSKNIIFLGVLILVSIVLIVGISSRHKQHFEHEDIDHDSHILHDDLQEGEHDADLSHNDHEKDGDESHEKPAIHAEHEEDEEIGIHIRLAEAGPGRLERYTSLAGEIVINADTMAHIVPRVPGVVEVVKKNLGDSVKAGEIIAIIESRDLADAKAAYLAAIERNKISKLSFEREERLRAEKISSEQDYLNAKQSFVEAQIELRNAEQKLRALGFTEQHLKKIPSEPEEMLTKFEISAPFDGTIIEKHITLGEVIRDDSNVYIIANLSTVWVDLSVYQKDLVSVKKGQKVLISAGDGVPVAHGKISYVGSFIGTDSRTALARVVLPNSSGIYRPGLFVTAKVLADDLNAEIVVPKDAVQTLEGKKCVFIKDEHGFEPRFVTVGTSDMSQIEIKSGLAPGEQYVVEGAFDLKAKIITSTLDSHAGHGH